MLVLLLAACTHDAVDTSATRTPGDSGGGTVDSGDTDTGTPVDSGGDDSVDDSTPPDTDPVDTDTDAYSGPPKWTVMVFINGDNNLEEWALADVNEMEEVGSDNAVNIVVQVDRSKGYTSADGDWTGARRYLVEQDDAKKTIGSPVVEDLGEVDSGLPETVTDFVQWAVSTYPADHYALILWDHGDNWSFAPQDSGTKGISYDYDSGHNLSVAHGDLTTVMSAATAAIGRPLDLAGADACTMESWEIAHTVAPYTGVWVGSQDYEAEAGWPYDAWLGDLVANPDMTAAELGASAALRFHEIPDSTMTAIDTSYVSALDGALDDLAQAMIDSGEAPSVFPNVAKGSQGFDGGMSQDHDLMDLTNKLDAATDSFTTETAAVRSVLTSMVLANYTMGGHVANAQGLTIYSPTHPPISTLYTGAAWSAESKWDDLLLATE